VAGPPSNRLNGDGFRVKVFSNGNAELEDFGIHDPRIIQAEDGYEGPAWRDETNFQLVVPYFPYCGRVDLIETLSGNVKLSVDLSQYATVIPPVANCKDIVVYLDENGEATITAEDVDNGSNDPEGGSIELSIDKSYFTCDDLGANSVILTVTDEEGAPAACTSTVTVVDDTPPEISLTVNPATLWPPNHRMTSVAVTPETVDNCDPSPACQIIQVQSNEPINGLGDGDSSPDWLITGGLSLDLRAERSGTGTGRIYTITVECTDYSGNTATANVDVTVPHEN
jgi:hypothetical protein